MAFPGVGSQKLSIVVLVASSLMTFTLTSVETGEVQLKGNQEEIKSLEVEEIKLTTKVKGERKFSGENTENIIGILMNEVITEEHHGLQQVITNWVSSGECLPRCLWPLPQRQYA